MKKLATYIITVPEDDEKPLRDLARRRRWTCVRQGGYLTYEDTRHQDGGPKAMTAPPKTIEELLPAIIKLADQEECYCTYTYQCQSCAAAFLLHLLSKVLQHFVTAIEKEDQKR